MYLCAAYVTTLSSVSQGEAGSSLAVTRGILADTQARSCGYVPRRRRCAIAKTRSKRCDNRKGLAKKILYPECPQGLMIFFRHPSG